MDKPDSAYQSPTHGTVSLNDLQKIISTFMSKDKNGHYEIIVGTDSQKQKDNNYDFVSALIVHHVGHGGIYFWKRREHEQKMSLKERMYREAIMSLETSESFTDLFRKNGISKYNIEIHVDIGHNGDTRDLINEVVGMIRGSGYNVKIKPDSYGASKVADRHT